MVVGYSLGNRQDEEEDIDILNEDEAGNITYTQSFAMSLTRMCQNNCPYCGFSRRDNLVVPYSTIKMWKRAREAGSREAFIVSGERPDKFTHIRATLDLWGFENYIDYVYTICELAFLEGLIPVVELGFLTPAELKQISEIAAIVRIMLDVVPSKDESTVYADSRGKHFEIRKKNLIWAGKLGIPVSTGVMVGIGETKDSLVESFQFIKEMHETYGNIHEVVIQNFVPQPGTKWVNRKAPTTDQMLAVLALAQENLPDDISLSIPLESNMADMDRFIKAGIRDFGRVFSGPWHPQEQAPLVTPMALQEVASQNGLNLHKRFSLRKSFIQNEKYSKKLGQVFEAYRYKIKKDIQEKLKSVKSKASEA